MFKFIGFLLIVCSGTVCGYSYAKKLSDRAVFIQRYMEFIMFIENEIYYNCADLLDIFNKYDSIGLFYNYIQKCKLYLNDDKAFPVGWKMSFSGVSKDIGISNSFETSILDFGLSLGNNDVQSQISHCKYHYNSTRTYLNQLLEQKKIKGKLYIILGTCFSTAIGLLFI